MDKLNKNNTDEEEYSELDLLHEVICRFNLESKLLDCVEIFKAEDRDKDEGNNFYTDEQYYSVMKRLSSTIEQGLLD